MKSHVLSPTDCQQIIQRKCGTSNFEILDCSITPFSDTMDGFLAEHLRAKFTILLNGKKTIEQFFVKVELTSDSNLMAKLSKETGAFAKEAFCFEKIFSLGSPKTWAPNFYLFKDDRIIVLEDASVKGFILPRVWVEEFDVEHCKLTLKSIAAFHAHSWHLEHKKSKQLGRPYFLGDEYPEKFQESLFGNGEMTSQWCHTARHFIESLITVLPANNCLSPEEFRSRFFDAFDRTYRQVGRSSQHRNAVCHGDLWRNNLLFRYHEDVPQDCMLIDFQLLRYCPPAHDVIMFLYVNTTRSFRDAHMESLLHYYHLELTTQLRNVGLDPDEFLSWNDFDASIPEQVQLSKIIAIIYKSIFLGGAAFFTKMHLDCEVLYQIMFGDRARFVLEMYRESHAYRCRMNEMLIELRETLTEDGLSREDVRKILRKKLHSNEFTLEKFEWSQIGDDRMGYLGEHKHLKVTYLFQDQRATKNFFAKFTPKVIEQLVFVTSSGGFRKEIFVYSVLYRKMIKMGIKQIEDVIAANYMTRQNDCLVFENLMEKRYKALDKYQKLNYDQVAVVVDTLAKFHSASLIYEELMTRNTQVPFRIGKRFLNDIKEPYYRTDCPIMISLMKASMNGLLLEVDLLIDKSHYNIDEIKSSIRTVYANFPRYVQSSTKYRNVINHGDLWANNIMMRYAEDAKPINCRLVDFQTCRYVPPTNDLMSFIYFTTTQAFRDRHMTAILCQYYTQLASQLAQYSIDVKLILPYDDFLESCRETEIFAATQAASFEQYILMSDDFITELYKNRERQQELLDGDRSYIISENCANDERYRSLLKDTITTLCNLCKTREIKLL